MESFLGEWKLSEDCKVSMNIEEQGEVLRCTWRDEQKNVMYSGVGIYYDHNLVISRVADKGKDIHGGVGVYIPLGEGRSHGAIWAPLEESAMVYSGIAIREDKGNDFEGSYTVRYFRNKHDRVTLELLINEDDTSDRCYSLEWWKDQNKLLHGVGIKIEEHMALAYTTLDIESEVVICKLEHKDGQLSMRMTHKKSDERRVHQQLYKKYERIQ